MTHGQLDGLVALYLLEHHDKRPSNTTVLELLEWSAARSTRAGGPAPQRCRGCGEFLSSVRVEMGIERCEDCQDRRRNGGRRPSWRGPRR